MDLELVLHKSDVRVEATVAVVNAKMESGENNFDGKLFFFSLSLIISNSCLFHVTHPLEAEELGYITLYIVS